MTRQKRRAQRRRRRRGRDMRSTHVGRHVSCLATYSACERRSRKRAPRLVEGCVYRFLGSPAGRRFSPGFSYFAHSSRPISFAALHFVKHTNKAVKQKLKIDGYTPNMIQRLSRNVGRDFAVSNDGVVSLIDITPTATVSDVVARSARGS